MTDAPTIEQAAAQLDQKPEPATRRDTPRDAWAIAALAAAISAGWAGRPSLWFDEGATISAAAGRTLPQLWKLLGHIDAVHGFYYLLMHAWFAVFPATEFWSRVPSALAIGAAAAGVVVFTRQFVPHSRATAICAGVLFAILPRVTWAGIEARSSALSVAVAVWLTVLLVTAARRDRPKLWICYGLVLMVSILISIHSVLLVAAYAAMVPLLVSKRSSALWWAGSSAVAVGLMTPFMLFAHGQIWQVGWISGLSRNLFLDVVHRQYFDHSIAFAVLAGVLLVAAGVARLAGLRAPAGLATGGRRLVLVCAAWIVVPTGIVLIYSWLIEPIYYPRYLIATSPAAAVILALCIVTLARRPWPIAVCLLLSAVAAFPGYYVIQRGPYAKEGWDYSQVADVIGSHAAPGDCLLVDNTVPWKPGPIRALLATRPAAFHPLIDVERGFYGPDVGALWDGHVAVWLTTAKINKCTTLWTITDRDRSMPDHQVGQSIPPGSAFGRAPVYRFPGYLGFHIVERWQFHYTQVVKSTR